MPILNDILEHKVLGREFSRGKAEGKAEGKTEGLQQGELIFLRKMMLKRFGSIPAWAEEAIASKSVAELDELGDRLMDARNIEDFLGKTIH